MNVHQVQMMDYGLVVDLFREVKADLRAKNNDQWRWVYPNRRLYKKDIQNGTMYGVKEGNEYFGVVTLDDQVDDLNESLVWKDRDGKPCCIHRLAVSPGRQGCGIGKGLLQFAENLARREGYSSVRIDVYSINETALSLYEKRGYAATGEVRYPLRKHPYIAMEKLLNVAGRG